MADGRRGTPATVAVAASVRRRAARDVLELGLKFREAIELEARLAASKLTWPAGRIPTSTPAGTCCRRPLTSNYRSGFMIKHRLRRVEHRLQHCQRQAPSPRQLQTVQDVI